MANVVIAYTGNVCSTPMIEYARLTSNIFVPVREHFDHYLFAKVFADDTTVCAEFSRVLAALYARRHTPYLDREEFVRYRRGGDIPSLDEKPHVLFKWRCFDPALPETEKIAEVFAANDVVPLIMLRSSLREQATKVFLSESVYGGRNPQFKASTMSPKDYAAYREEQGQISVTVSAADIQQIGKIAGQFLFRTERLIDQLKVFFPATPHPKLIFAEDIFRPLIDFDRYQFALVSLFGERGAFGTVTAPAIRKGGLELSNCANFDAVLEDADLRDLETAYQTMAARLTNVFG